MYFMVILVYFMAIWVYYNTLHCFGFMYQEILATLLRAELRKVLHDMQPADQHAQT
jgi:hypothetical protein